MSDPSISRRRFLKTLGAGILSAGIVVGCSGKNIPASSSSAGAKTSSRSLKVLQQTHFVPAFDEWFDKDHTQKWGQSNDAAVSVDHLPLASIYPKAAGEAAARAGHDVVGFIAPPAMFENEVEKASSDLVGSVDSVSAVVEENTAATEQMSASSSEVSKMIENIASISEENNAAVEEVSAATEEMSAQVQEVSQSAAEMAQMAQALREQVELFKF